MNFGDKFWRQILTKNFGDFFYFGNYKKEGEEDALLLLSLCY
jgi:hypothetical protein